MCLGSDIIMLSCMQMDGEMCLRSDIVMFSCMQMDTEMCLGSEMAEEEVNRIQDYSQGLVEERDERYLKYVWCQCPCATFGGTIPTQIEKSLHS